MGSRVASNLSQTNFKQKLRNLKVNNLAELREQIKEDLMCYFNNGAEVEEWAIDEVCHIVVDRVSELVDNINNE